METKEKNTAPEALFTFLVFNEQFQTIDEFHTLSPNLEGAIYELLYKQATMIEANLEDCDEDEYLEYAQTFIIGEGREDLIQDYGHKEFKLVGIHVRPQNTEDVIVVAINPASGILNVRVSEETERNPLTEPFLESLYRISTHYQFNSIVAKMTHTVYRNVFQRECPTLTKPPQGVQPRRLWLEQRIKDLRRAIIAYQVAGFPIQADWVVEEEFLTIELEKYDQGHEK